MNKAQLIGEVAKRAGLTKKAAALAVDATFNAIRDALAAGKSVRLIGFGTFAVRKRAARKGRNPQTKAVINIPAKKVPVFRPSSQLKEKVK